MSRNKLIPPRLLLILLASSVSGTVIGILTFLAYGNVPGAIIAGLTAFGVALAFFNSHVDDDNQEKPHDTPHTPRHDH